MRRRVLDVAAGAAAVHPPEGEHVVPDLAELGRHHVELLPHTPNVVVVLAHPVVAEVRVSLVRELRGRSMELDGGIHHTQRRLEVTLVERVEGCACEVGL